MRKFYRHHNLSLSCHYCHHYHAHEHHHEYQHQTNNNNGFKQYMILFQFTEVMFVDGSSKNKASFIKTGGEITFSNNYNKAASTYGQWNGHGVALDTIKYQLMICDVSFYKGIHISGHTNSCYKTCGSWCNDNSSPYFRTAAVTSAAYAGVAFNVNGHRAHPKRVVSVGIR